MRKLCPNLEREDGLDTVLEVPIPEEMLMSDSGSRGGCKSRCTNMKSWVRPHARSSPISRGAEIQLMLGVIGAPLVPLPVRNPVFFLRTRIKDDPIEASMAKYILQQYIAAVGGEKALATVGSMYAMGRVRMSASEFGACGGRKSASKIGSGGEMGGFVLWQKKPDLWCLELVVSGCKISAGSDGRVAWRQTPWHQAHASRGPPRPLRRSLQGLDPTTTASLFSHGVCIGEKTINGEDCFVLRVDAEATALGARSGGNVEIVRHTVWGCFSQRTALLAQLEDFHLLRIKSPASEDSVYWETTTASSVEDYRPIDGVKVAHAGRTAVTLLRLSGGDGDGRARTRMEEIWTIEEVDFNIRGLSNDCFLPPGDLKEAMDGCDDVLKRNQRQATSITIIGPTKVAAVDVDDSNWTEEGLKPSV